MGNDLNWLFIAAVTVLLVCLVNGYSKGFLRLTVSVIGTIIIIVAVIYLSPTVSDYLMQDEEIFNSIRSKVTETFINENDDRLNLTKEEQAETIENFDLPEILINALITNNTDEMYSALMVTIFDEYISVYIAKLIIRAGAFVGLFIALNIIMKIILCATDLANRIPVVKGFNRLLGAMLGLAEGVFFIWIFYFVVITFLGNTAGNALIADVKDSVLLSYLFNKNMLIKFIS